MSEWVLGYDGFEPAKEGLREALCTLGNGYFATRGASPESSADDVHYPGTYLAGYYDRLTSDVSGREVENEDIVNMPNWLPLHFRAEGADWFEAATADILEYRQELDIAHGVLTRRFRFRDAQGRTTRVHQRRIVHIAEPHLAALETVFTAEDWSGSLEVVSALDGRVSNSGVARYRALRGDHLRPVDQGILDEESVWLEVETTQSGLRVAEAARTRVFRDGHRASASRRVLLEPGYIGHRLRLDMQPEQPVRVEKAIAVFGSRDHAISEPALEARKHVSRAGDFEELRRRHVLEWNLLWRRFQVDLGLGEREELVLNLHIFHLLQTVSQNSIGLDVGVPARGLHGEAYRGHIFWDELFVFPFLNFRLPEITRALLMYRYRRLPEARLAAKQAGYQGAMFPWQSGSDGREESQLLHLNPESGRWIPDNTHLQRHINIAVAYNVWQYYDVTADLEFLSFYGAEMIVEIARFWASISQYDEETDRYEIRGVMGPDEYHDAYPWREEGGVDNNAYTNVMAAWVLTRACEVLHLLPSDQQYELRHRLGVTDEELGRWNHVSRRMKVPFHDDGIVSQFEGYERLEEFDWEGYRARHGEINRLDRVLEAEGDTPNRYKASKQADVLMLFYLLSAEQLTELFEQLGYGFDPQSIRRNIDYYLERTSHGSTLSTLVHSWVLARSDRPRSWCYFRDSLESDIDDVQGGTTPEGIHLGAMAGSIDLVQRGWTGIEPRGGVLWINPAVPDNVPRMRFSIRYKAQPLDIEITQDVVRVSALPAAVIPICVGFRGQVECLAPGEVLELPLGATVPA